MGLGYDTGAQGALASVGTSEGLTGTNVRVGGKDVTARGTHTHASCTACLLCTAAWPLANAASHFKPAVHELNACMIAWIEVHGSL